MALVTKNFSDIITFTRASTGTFFDSSGVLTSAAIDAPRFDYNPSTLAAQGLLIEEARTNSIRNNTMVGAVAGTPGTLPTNWNVASLGTLTREVVGTGVVNGITYIDLRFSGTTSTTQLSIRLEPGGTGSIAAVNGQTWSMSLWSAVVAGGLTNISSQGFGTLIYDAAGAFLGAPFSSGVITTTSTLTRTQASGTIETVGTAFIQPQIFLNFASGVAIDITLRIGLPQLEQGAFATSVIPTTTTALTRNADVAAVNTLSPWYNSSAGTLFAEWYVWLNRSQQVFGIVTAGDGVRLNKNGLNNYVFVVRDPTNRDLGIVPVPALTEGQIIKVAGAYATNDVAMSAGGQTPVSGSVYAPPTPNLAFIGGALSAGAVFTGHIRRITYYPRRLSNAELQAITA